MAEPDEADSSIFDPRADPDAPASHRSAESRPLRGVITDWGGVMTSPIIDTVTAWLEADWANWGESGRRGIRPGSRKYLQEKLLPQLVHIVEGSR